MSPVAVIDIGSNSIKILIVERDANGVMQTLVSETRDARISEGISRDQPMLSEEGMRRGVSAIRELFTYTIPFEHIAIQLVATSAVRDAGNGEVFQTAVKEATGHTIRILTGEEEANLIGLGITCDPALTALRDFQLFDLGGGSLECLHFEAGLIRQATSLQLGCVRLSETCLTDRTKPLPTDQLNRIRDLSITTLQSSGLPIATAPSLAIGTGGTLATVRAIVAAREGQSFEESSAVLPIEMIRSLRDELASLDLTTRQQIEGLPEARADVFPTALTTLLAVAEYGTFTGFHHSLYNLRYGVAKQMLDSVS